MTTIDHDTPGIPVAATDSARPAKPFLDTRIGRALTGLFAVGLGLLVWEVLSWYIRPLFLPSPRATLVALGELW